MSTTYHDAEGFTVEKARPEKQKEDALLCPNCLKQGKRNADGSRPKLWNGEKCRTCGYRAMTPAKWDPANHSDSAKRGWVTRRMRYGLLGVRQQRKPITASDELFA